MLLKWLGGLKKDASIDDINLAYKLEDGMKIYIPILEEKENEEQLQNSTNNDKNMNSANTINSTGKKDLTEKYVTTSSGTGKSNLESIEKGQSTKVNINTATQEQLETLPGIGPSTASKIIGYRTEKGNFNNIEDIKEVSGIGDAKFEKIKDFI